VYAELKLDEDGSVRWTVKFPSRIIVSIVQWIGPRNTRVCTQTLKPEPNGRVQSRGPPRLGEWVAEAHSDDEVLVFGVAVLVMQPENVGKSLHHAWNLYSRGNKPPLGEGAFGAVYEVTKLPQFKVNDDVQVIDTARIGKVKTSPQGCFGRCEVEFSDGLQPSAAWFRQAKLAGSSKQLVAKVLESERKTWSAVHEAHILQQLSSHEEFPKFEGLCRDIMGEPVIVMEKLSRNLYALFDHPKVYRKGQLSAGTVIHVGLQCISRLQLMHRAGIVHRDIKPENIVIGSNASDVYLIDFGLSRYFRVANQDFPVQKSKGISGSLRYCSVRAHGGLHTPYNDLESLAYVLIFLAAGKLPWQGMRVRPKEALPGKIKACKEDFSLLETSLQESLESELRLRSALLEMIKYCRQGTGNNPEHQKLAHMLACAKPMPIQLDWRIDAGEGAGSFTEAAEQAPLVVAYVVDDDAVSENADFQGAITDKSSTMLTRMSSGEVRAKSAKMVGAALYRWNCCQCLSHVSSVPLKRISSL